MENILIVLPLRQEYEEVVRFFQEKGWTFEKTRYVRALDKCQTSNLTLATGGHGKAQCAATTRYLLDTVGPFSAVICAGTAGDISQELKPGDVVLGKETVEYDMKPIIGKTVFPRFGGDRKLIKEIITAFPEKMDFKIVKAGIASGDEDVVDNVRASEIRKATGCAVTAWEGAGCARACVVTRVPFLEIRAVTDFADEDTEKNFSQNFKFSVRNLAFVMLNWMRFRKI